ncbi:MAG: hypothetical protein JW729_09500 [Bacteroidales bacterium]|nr:hypothetical protein [Bacteroidales bacterium]
MKENNFITKLLNGNKPLFYGIIAVGISIVLLIFVLIAMLVQTNAKAKYYLQSDNNEGVNLSGWQQSEYQDIWKDKFWVENQLTLAKDDSMSLGIHLNDRIFQLQFKGLPLIKSKILAVYPKQFNADFNELAYKNLFSQPWVISSQQANKQKKPFRKMTVNTDGSTNTEEDKNPSTEPILWSFLTENDYRVVVFGVKQDSSQSTNFKWQMYKDRFRTKLKNSTNSTGFYPTIYLWISDADALAIFRALPENAKIGIRN